MVLQLAHESLAMIKEADLVQRLISDPHWRGRLLGVHGIPADATPYPEVPLEALGREGDIDILVVHSSRPDLATAIQVKRIKVQANTFRSGSPNRLSALDELRRQTNVLVELGFAQVFCFAIVVVDSREHNRGEYRFDGLTAALRKTIEGLSSNAGFVHYELVQPVDDVPLHAGTYSGKVLRLPKVRLQPPAITEWVKCVVRNANA